MGKGLTASVATLLATLVSGTAALGHEVGAADLDGGGPDGVPKKVEEILGGQVTALDDGLYRVRSSRAGGFSYTTHGPDFGPDVQRPFGDMRDVVAPADVRDPSCATDYYQEVLYAYPSSGTNNLATKKASIQDQIRTNDAILNSESLASGGPEADYKVLCAGDGTIKVTAFSVPSADPTATFNEIVAAAHTFAVFATDGAGNPDASPATRSFSVDAPDPPPPVSRDSVPPQTRIDSGPRSLRQGKKAVFTFSASEPGANFECRLDRARFAACSSPNALRRVRKGRHTFEVRAADGSGNADATPAAKRFRVKPKLRWL